MSIHPSFYSRLGVEDSANNDEIRAAFRKLVLTKHPDKGGSEEDFMSIQTAYEVLIDPRRRRIYDRYGEKGLEQSAESLFSQEFRAGSFGPDAAQERDLQIKVDALRRENESLQRQMMIVKSETENKFARYASSFEAWLRNRNPGQLQVVTSDTLAKQIGISEGTYESVRLPELKSMQARYIDQGELDQVVQKSVYTLPNALKWGEVLVHMLAAPVTSVDRSLAQSYHIPGEEMPKHPAPVGAEGVGIVICVGPGVDFLKLHDLVLPKSPIIGTWRRLGVFNQSQLHRFPPTTADPELIANFYSYCTAFQILEDSGSLRPGDTIIQSNAESVVGQTVIQLCKILQIKTINLVEDRADFEELSDLLQAQGATYVWKDSGSILARINRLNASLPRLGIDGRGGERMLRIAECLRPNSTLVLYSSDLNKVERFPYVPLIYNNIAIRGFWLYRWLEENADGFQHMTDRLLPLLEDGKLKVFTSRWERVEESLEAALRDPKPNVLLQFASLEQATALRIERKQKDSIDMGKEETIADWLSKLGFNELIDVFVEYGYDDLNKIKASGLQKEDLEFMGIEVPLHQRILIEASKKWLKN